MEVRESKRTAKRVNWKSTVGSWIAGILIQLPIYMAFGIEFVKSPFTVVLILWMAAASAAVVLVDEGRSKRCGRKSARRREMKLLPET